MIQAEYFRTGFEDRLLAVLCRYRGVGTGETGSPCPVFLAALSGGADSTAMAAALGAIRDSADRTRSSAGGPFPFALRCLHVNHNIRGREECFEDERHVIALCKTLSIPLRIHRVKPGAIKAYARVRAVGIEAAARYFRHDALRKEARRVGAAALLVAHTKDDLLETVLMAVLRGSGPAGLGAMAEYAAGFPAEYPSGLGASPGSGFPIIRPLLGITRAEVIGYLAGRGLSYTNDSSNNDTRFLRNRIRRILVPFLDREFPHWRTPLLSLNKTQAGIAAFLASEAPRRLPWNREGEILFLAEKDFFDQSPALREEALFQALDILCLGPDSAPAPGSVPISGSGLPSAPESPISLSPESRTLPEHGGFRPRRAALRPFVAGEKAACDLGLFRLEKKNGRIIVRKNSPFGGSRGFRKAFSVLIKSPGLYKLETLTLRSFPAGTMTEGPVSSCGFFASFPLVLRSLERKESPVVEVRDRDGRAAIVGFQGEIVWVRKGGSRNGSYIVPGFAAQKPAGE
ncbi:MAG: tRNA lysidine(34) synthetase TilS [Treponema sp.]|nr:tRNA lysidine(34) synthetase TilS [Treponema sp.]